MSLFEGQLTLWTGLCIVGDMALGKVRPGRTQTLERLAASTLHARVPTDYEP